MPARAADRLYEPAAPEPAGALASIGPEHLLYVGPIGLLAAHTLPVRVLVVGVDGEFRMRTPGSDWSPCRAAVVPAGVQHEMDFSGGNMAAVAVEPQVGGTDGLCLRLRGTQALGALRVAARVDGDVPRAIADGRCAPVDAWAWFAEWAGLDSQAREPVLDPRIARALRHFGAVPHDRSSAADLARDAGLSESRFLHLFSGQVGAPLRRYRAWNRLRAATHAALLGASLTEAAHMAGFADSAHFSRTFRDMLGEAPSGVLGRVGRTARVGMSG